MMGKKTPFILLLVFISHFSQAGIPDMPQMYKRVAEESRVPPSIFYALALTESRSTINHNKSPTTLPWPWTINYRGQGYFFPTKKAAHAFISSLVERGENNFDIGLGQINWYWHRTKFESLWDALDPYKNLSVSARHLRRQYDRPECSSWTLAIGCYHRPGQREKDKRIAKKYMKKVITIWGKI